MMDLLEDVNWPAVGIVYIILMVAMWSPIFTVLGSDDNPYTWIFKLGASIVMIPIIILIVYIRGD